jgi:small subunit ribosomal protein S7
MPRRARVVKRDTPPDPRYGNRVLQRFINKVMYDGKKSTAERVVYGALKQIEEQMHRNPLEVFEQALRNSTPVLVVKPRRVGGAT